MYYRRKPRSRWCAVLVLVGVCLLTISLATRYNSPISTSSHSVKTIQSETSPESKRQRLTKNAANWMPVVLSFTILHAPVFYPRIAPTEPPAPSLVVAQQLYTRPPPTV
jgi:hypothetical protein